MIENTIVTQHNRTISLEIFEGGFVLIYLVVLVRFERVLNGFEFFWLVSYFINYALPRQRSGSKESQISFK